MMYYIVYISMSYKTYISLSLYVLTFVTRSGRGADRIPPYDRLDSIRDQCRFYIARHPVSGQGRTSTCIGIWFCLHDATVTNHW